MPDPTHDPVRFWLNGTTPVPLAAGESPPDGFDALTAAELSAKLGKLARWTPEALAELHAGMTPDRPPATIEPAAPPYDAGPFADVTPFWAYVGRLQSAGMSLAPAVYTVADILVSDAAVATQTHPVDVPYAGEEHWPDDDADGELELQLGHAFNEVGKILRELVARYAEADARRVINGTPRKGVKAAT